MTPIILNMLDLWDDQFSALSVNLCQAFQVSSVACCYLVEDGCELWPIVNIVTSEWWASLTSLHYTPQQGEWDLEDQWGHGEAVLDQRSVNLWHIALHNYVTIDEINGNYLLYLPSMPLHHEEQVGNNF